MTGFELFLVLSGFLIGSAIDAAADRLTRGESWAMPRSRCTACQRALKWYELVPIISWTIARGRCRSCQAPIGYRAPLTEIAGALIAVAAVALRPEYQLILCFTVLFGWLLLALSAIDLRLYILPDGLNLAVLLLGGAMVALQFPHLWPWHLAGAVAGYGLLWLVETGYRRLRGRDGLGRGDAKLLGAIGMWVGIEGIPPVLLVASLSGIIAVLAMSSIRKESVTGLSAIAFGPWIALGGYSVWLLPPLLSTGA